MTAVRADQHFFTAKGYSYKTTAVSPGVTKEIRVELESCVDDYTPQNIDHPKQAQRVYRGRRIPQGWAASMLTDAERAFGRNNRVAHTFFLTGDSMATQGYNLPWIACHLPFDRDYTPRLISDLEELAPVDLPIDPERQFHLLAMVASELGASAIGHAFHGVLAAFTQPHVLVWPEPSRDAAQQYATFFGLGAPMNADHVQLARLAGVCALFPVAFAAELSFSLNESSRFKSLVSAPHRGTPVAEPPEERPWLAWCLEFAEAGDSGALVEARQALSSLLPVGTKPSGAALDRTFDFWRRCKATTGDTSWRAKADAIQPLVGLDVDLSTVYEMSVASAGAVHGDQAPLVDALIALGDRASRPLPAPVFQRLLQQIRDVEPEGARVHLMRRLPWSAQAQIWADTVEQRVYPGHLADRSAPIDVRFVLRAFNPELPISPSCRESVLVSLEAALDRVGAATPRPPGLSPDHRVARTLRGLSDLGAGRFEEADVHPAVLSYLAQQWSGTVLNNAAAASFHQVDPSLRLNLKLRHVSVEDELFHVLRNVSPGQFAGAAAATLVSDLARHEPVGAAGAVLRYLELAPDLYANASLVRRFAPWPPGGSHALICLEELFARTSGRGMSAHPPHVVLGSFAAWTSLIRLRDQQEGRLVTLFVSYLTALVKALPSSMGAAALGACYLRLVPGEAHALVRVVVDRFRSAESQIAEQRPLTFDRPPFAVIGDLFPVIVRYGPRDTYGVLLASIGRSAERAGAERTSELIADVERYCHLTKADMPRELRQYLKNRPSSGWSFFS